jgi:hypothetical protein
MTANTITKPTVDELTRSWPTTSRDAAQTVMGHYGPPDEASDEMLIWYENRPWKYTILWRDEVPHDFPTPHHDVLQQFIDYQVPADRFSELARFDGSVVDERTKGELSARCEGEEMNLLAINLSHELAAGNIDADETRQRYSDIAKAFHEGTPFPYTQDLLFDVPQGGTADKDEITLPETILQRIGEQHGFIH